MNNKYKKSIDEIIRCLNWTVVLDYYNSSERNHSKFFGKLDKGKAVTRQMIEKEIHSVVMFVIDNNVPSFEVDNWLVMYKQNEGSLGFMIEVIFAPTKACSFENEMANADDYKEDEEDLHEKNVLLELLDKSVTEENYELSAVLRDRIRRLDRNLAKRA